MGAQLAQNSRFLFSFIEQKLYSHWRVKVAYTCFPCGLFPQSLHEWNFQKTVWAKAEASNEDIP